MHKSNCLRGPSQPTLHEDDITQIQNGLLDTGKVLQMQNLHELKKLQYTVRNTQSTYLHQGQ